jgi:hypothetical protein
MDVFGLPLANFMVRNRRGENRQPRRSLMLRKSGEARNRMNFLKSHD